MFYNWLGKQNYQALVNLNSTASGTKQQKKMYLKTE